MDTCTLSPFEKGVAQWFTEEMNASWIFDMQKQTPSANDL